MSLPCAWSFIPSLYAKKRKGYVKLVKIFDATSSVTIVHPAFGLTHAGYTVGSYTLSEASTPASIADIMDADNISCLNSCIPCTHYM